MIDTYTFSHGRTTSLHEYRGNMKIKDFNPSAQAFFDMDLLFIAKIFTESLQYETICTILKGS